MPRCSHRSKPQPISTAPSRCASRPSDPFREPGPASPERDSAAMGRSSVWTACRMQDALCVMPPGASRPCGGTKKKVLVDDDEYLIRYSMQKLIEHEGYSAVAAGSAQEAL